jgi:hypothetical protein
MTRLKLSAVIVCLSTILFAACKKDVVEFNKVPAVDAGTHQTITGDVDSVTLSGSASDSDGYVVAYLWSQVSGPVPATIATPGSATTTITNMINGNYVFQLMATDNDGATGVDTVSVKIDRPTEHTVIIQPSNNAGEFLLGIRTGAGDQSGPGATDYVLAAWTVNGDPVTIRELLKFDMSSIPANATIKSANLYLYSYPPPTLNGNFTDANFGTNNAFFIQQVTANWTPGTANWSNQPATTTANQILVPHTAQSMLDLNIDVKAMVSSMVATNNYGFLMKLQNENYYTSRIFVGSRSPNLQAKYPKLVVVFE